MISQVWVALRHLSLVQPSPGLFCSWIYNVVQWKKKSVLFKFYVALLLPKEENAWWGKIKWSVCCPRPFPCWNQVVSSIISQNWWIWGENQNRLKIILILTPSNIEIKQYAELYIEGLQIMHLIYSKTTDNFFS